MRKANAGQSATETPTEEADTWRVAQLLVDRLGAEARAHAANRANELLDIQGPCRSRVVDGNYPRSRPLAVDRKGFAGLTNAPIGGDPYDMQATGPTAKAGSYPFKLISFVRAGPSPT